MQETLGRDKIQLHNLEKIQLCRDYMEILLHFSFVFQDGEPATSVCSLQFCLITQNHSIKIFLSRDNPIQTSCALFLVTHPYISMR